MSLRKSPRRTPRLRAAARRNAQRSTGPRSAAGKGHSKMNAVKHGERARPEHHLLVMRALGEDPQAFENLKQQLLTIYGPGDALWKQQIDDLARLYWRRGRLQRAQEGVQRRALLAVEEWQHGRRRELEGVSFDASQPEMLNVPTPEPADPGVRLRKILSFLGAIREQVAQSFASQKLGGLSADSKPRTAEFEAGEPGCEETRSTEAVVRACSELETLYRGRMSCRAGRMCQLLRLFCEPSGAGAQDLAPRRAGAPGEARYQELLRLLEEEIAGVQEEFEYGEKLNEEKAAIERDACLAPDTEVWRMMVRQEAALDRSIDRKVRILLAMRKEFSATEMMAFPRGDLGGLPGEQEDEVEVDDVNELLMTQARSQAPAEEGADRETSPLARSEGGAPAAPCLSPQAGEGS